MLWIIICVLLLIIGIFISDKLDVLKGVSLIVGIIITIIIVIAFTAKPSDRRTVETKYALTKTLVDFQSGNKHITGEERACLISDIISINRKLIKDADLKKSLWRNVFINDFSHLPLLEYNGIKYVDNKHTIQLTE